MRERLIFAGQTLIVVACTTVLVLRAAEVLRAIAWWW